MTDNSKSSYLQYLPAIYQRGSFMGQFLKIFEKLLGGIEDDVVVSRSSVAGQDGGQSPAPEREYPGIGQILDSMADYFDPHFTPAAFLDWLADWVALDLPDDWAENVKRRIIPQALSLYKKRGTKQGLEEFLKLYVGPGVYINEGLATFQVGENMRLGETTRLGSGPMGFFSVKIVIPEADPNLKKEMEAAVRTIIDKEKPAHTYYSLETFLPAMQVGPNCLLGINTLLVDNPTATFPQV